MKRSKKRKRIFFSKLGGGCSQQLMKAKQGLFLLFRNSRPIKEIGRAASPMGGGAAQVIFVLFCFFTRNSDGKGNLNLFLSLSLSAGISLTRKPHEVREHTTQK